MLRLVFSATAPKDTAYPESNEDAFRCSDDDRRYAISDGASESFDAKTWATLLTDRYLCEPGVSSAWAQEAVSEYKSKIDIEQLSWSKQAAYERGSFATLLGIEYDIEHQACEILAIGDSLAVLMKSNEICKTFPISSAEELDKNPELLSTHMLHNDFLSSPSFYSTHVTAWAIEPGDIIFLMTDALAGWLLRKAEAHDDEWKILSTIEDHKAFEELIEELRRLKSIKIDDTTLLRLEME